MYRIPIHASRSKTGPFPQLQRGVVANGFSIPTTQKRLGDGFYEQRLINEEVAELTGRRFLANYTSDEAQYQALMDAGVTVARSLNLIPGIALSAEEMAALTTDIVWLVEKTVKLPDGTTQQVLVPQVYVRVQAGDLAPSGALIAGNSIKLNLTGDLTNSGSIAGRQLVTLTAENIRNLGGRISGQEVVAAARNDLANLGGTLAAENQLIASAGRDLTVASTTRTQTNAQGSRTHIDRVAGLYVTGANGTLVASAGNDLTLLAALLSNAALMAAGTVSTNTPGSTTLVAGNNLTLGTVSEAASHQIVWDGKNTRSDASQSEVGSVIQSAGDLALQAGNDFTARAASVTSAQGALTVLAGNNLTISAGQSANQVDEAHQHKEKGNVVMRAGNAYLLECHRYIELNPVRAAMVEHPGMYRWSSYRANAQGEASPFLKPHPLYASLGAIR